MAHYEYVNNVDAQAHCSEYIVESLENNVNICRVVRINTAPIIDNDLVPRPPDICSSKGSRTEKLNKVIEDFNWDHLTTENKEMARDVIIDHEEVFYFRKR